jgi:hypothetical protein
MEEIYRIINDPIYTINNYLKYYDLVRGGFVNFDLIPKQKEILTNLDNHRFNNIIKSRQVGLTTLLTTKIVTKLISAPVDEPEDIFVISPNRDASQHIIKMIRDQLMNLPDELMLMWGNTNNLVWNNRLKIQLPNGSRVTATHPKPDTFRGHRPTWVIFDEAAFIEDGKKCVNGLMPALTENGSLTLVSTPNGRDNLFWESVLLASLGASSFKNTFIKWYHIPKYTKDLVWMKNRELHKNPDMSEEELILNGYMPTSSWYRSMCSSMNQNMDWIHGELDCIFL